MDIEANITPKVLFWARDTAGWTIEDVVKKLNQKKVDIQTITDWEKGARRPTFSQLEKLAKFYERPVAVFFFPKPPRESKLEALFRTLPKDHARRLPPRIRFLTREAMVRQIDLRELKGEGHLDSRLLELQKSSFSASELAIRVRSVIAVPPEEQFSWKKGDCANALKIWRRKLENLGIWVFKDSFKEDDFCGFYLPDNAFPIIYINDSMPHSRQIFTLFHELGHFLLSKGGIDFRDSKANELSEEHAQEEVFCNKFAEAFLVPDDSLDINHKNYNNEIIQDLAAEYKVSREVILRKYLDKDIIGDKAYQDKVKQWKHESDKLKQQKRANKINDGNYYATLATYLGNKYLELAFSQYYMNRIDEYQLADYLDVKLDAIPVLEGLMLKPGD